MNNILVNTLFQWVLLIGIIYYTRKYSKIYVVPLVITYLLFLYKYPDSPKINIMDFILKI